MSGSLLARCHVRLVVNLKHLDGNTRQPTETQAGLTRAAAIEVALKALPETGAAYREVLSSAGRAPSSLPSRETLFHIPLGRVGKKGSRLLYGVEEQEEEEGEEGRETEAAGGSSGKKRGGSARKRGLGRAVDVEQLVREHVALGSHGGWDSAHDEGRALRRLFGLLMHEQIFAAVPDAFFTPAQTAPLDLLDPSFYEARQEAIDARLAEVAAPTPCIYTLCAHTCTQTRPCTCIYTGGCHHSGGSRRDGAPRLRCLPWQGELLPLH